jgi:hypothetical protein
MTFRHLLTQNSIKFDRNQWVNILGTIIRKNYHLDCREVRPQIMFNEKRPQNQVFWRYLSKTLLT